MRNKLDDVHNEKNRQQSYTKQIPKRFQSLVRYTKQVFICATARQHSATSRCIPVPETAAISLRALQNMHWYQS